MNHEQTIAWWKDQAPTYFTDKVFSFSQKHLIDRLGIVPESKILELGFGYGRELSQFCKLSHHVYGVELTEYTCALARRELLQQGITTRPTLQTYDGKTLPFDESTFDVVYSCFLLQHMSRPAAKEMIREALRVTNYDGRVLMQFFGDPVSRHATEEQFCGDPTDGSGMYNNAYSPDAITAMVGDLGSIVWLEPQRICLTDSKFDNHWLCITKAS